MDDPQQLRFLFEKWVNTWTKEIFRYAFWLCGNQDTAEELVQETFARAWKALQQLKDEDKAKSWLLTILRRENARRHEGYQPEREILNLDEIANSRSL